MTLQDTEERRRYLNARSTIDKLLEWRAVPVINENDTVATNEIRYGDNDRLAARVATMASADLLVLLSDVDGLYDAPPAGNAQAKLVPLVERITPAIEAMAGAAGSELSRGGMADQDRGRQDRDPRRHAHGDRLRPRRPSAGGHRRRALHLVPHARQSRHRAQEMDRRLARAERRSDDRRRRRRGAAQRQEPAPAGVIRIDGMFARGDAVVIRGPDGAEIGRGLVAYDAEDAVKIRGRSSADILSILGFGGRAEMVHRDDLVMGRA